MNPPTAAEPILLPQLPCAACGGDPARSASCPACGGEGCATVAVCPREVITPDVVELCEMVDFVAKGAWPVAGGVLDQTDVFLRARDMLLNEEARYNDEDDNG